MGTLTLRICIFWGDQKYLVTLLGGSTILGGQTFNYDPLPLYFRVLRALRLIRSNSDIGIINDEK